MDRAANVSRSFYAAPPGYPGLKAWYTGSSWRNNSRWTDLTGYSPEAQAALCSSTGLTNTTLNGWPVIIGDTCDSIVFPTTLAGVPAYTLFSVASYNETAAAPTLTVVNGTVVNSTGPNTCNTIVGSDSTWYSGFAPGCKNGLAGHGSSAASFSLMSDTSYSRFPKTSWLVSVDQLLLYRAQGVQLSDVPLNGSATTSAAPPPARLGVNLGPELSTWRVAEILMYDRELNETEVIGVEEYLAHKYNLTLHRPLATLEPPPL